MRDDINEFEDMIAECYKVLIGTKRTIELTKKAFEINDIKLSPNIVFYEIDSTSRTEKKLVLVADKRIKIEILKYLHIL